MTLEERMEEILCLTDEAPSGVNITHELLNILKLLLQKNISYGDSALHPIKIFSTESAELQIRTRIDDKLNRIKNQKEFENEDTIQDLIGYLILLQVVRHPEMIEA